VREEDDGVEVGAHMALTIMSEDRTVHVTYPIGQSGPHSFAILKDRENEGAWRRVACPDWPMDGGAVTPKLVRTVVQWVQNNTEFQFVDYLGRPEKSNV